MFRINNISRRAFLKRSGAFAAMVYAPAVGLPPKAALGQAAAIGSSLGLPGDDQLAGRAFGLTQVRLGPDIEAGVVGRLLPDSVSTITGLSEDGWWYHVDDGNNRGYVRREAVQPVAPYRLAENIPGNDHVGYYEVVAPTLSVREYCAGHARVLARLGYGAVVYVHDGLADERGQRWRAVTISDNRAGFFGWLGATLIRPIRTGFTPHLSAPSIWIDTTGAKLSVYDGDTFIGESATYSGPLLRGTATLTVNAPAVWVPGPPFARPWTMTLDSALSGPIPVCGAFWHNKFGGGRLMMGVELPIFAARWRYDMVSQRAGGVPVIVE